MEIVYSLQGQSLDIAKKIQVANEESQEHLDRIELQVAEFKAKLINEFEEQHGATFKNLFSQMAQAICVPIEQLKSYHLDLTYIDTHELAFLKEGPVVDNVLVMNVDEKILSDCY